MKNSLLIIMTFAVVSLCVVSCTSFLNVCEEIECNTGTLNEDCTCDCPDGFSGDNCEIEDLCFNVTCDYDGNCVDGTCVCTSLTQDYITGDWLIAGSLEYSFAADGTWDLKNNPDNGTYTISDSPKRINISSSVGADYYWDLPEDQFTCDEFHLVQDNGAEGDAVRQ